MWLPIGSGCAGTLPARAGVVKVFEACFVQSLQIFDGVYIFQWVAGRSTASKRYQM